MHSSRMRTAHSLTISHGILAGVHILPHMPPCHTCNHTPTMHTPCHACPLPHMLPPCHTCPPPCMPPATPQCHACPLCHAHPVSYMPPCHTHLPAMHTPLPCMSLCHACPPVNRMTDRCTNITFANFVCGQ